MHVRTAQVTSYSLLGVDGRFATKEDHEEVEIFLPLPELSSYTGYWDFARKVWEVATEFAKANISSL